MGIDREKVIQNAQKLVEKKKYDKAIVEYQRLVQEDPNDARTILKIGDLQARMEAYGDAIATYEKVGKFYSTQGFSAKAIAVYKQIKEIIAKHVPHLEERYAHITPRLAEIYEHMGLVADAVGAWDEVVAKQQAAGRENEALETMRHIVSLDTNNPFSHLKLAEGLSKARQTDEAVSVFAETAAILAKLGRRDDALKVLERLLHHKSDSAHARVAAEMYLTRGQANDAMLALSKLQICFQANPKDLDTLGLLARAFNAIGQSSKAIEVQKEAARIARDQNRMDVFDEIVTYLIEMAPDDIEVRRLAGFEPEDHDGDANHARSQQPSAYELSDDDAVEDLDDSAFEEVDEDFVMDEDQDILAAGRDEAAQAGPISEEFVATELPPTSTEDPFAQSDFGMEPANAFEEPQGQNGFAYSSSIEDADYAEDAFASGQVEEAFIDVSEPPRAGVDEAALARVLADVASFQRAKIWGRAIDLLVGAKERFPRSTELSQTLAQVYSEAGRPEDAVAEMLDLAAMLIDGLDGDAAAQVLQDVLAYDPVNGDAIRMLRDLGYEVIEEEEAPAPQPFVPPVYGLDSDDVGADANDGSFGSNAPLPAYELEGDGLDDGEIHPLSGQTNGGGSPSFGHGPTAAHPGVATAGRNGRFSSLPAGENLPSFALERNAAASASRGAVRGSDLPSFGETGLSAAPPVNISKAPNSLTFADLEDALEESEFFASRGLFQDARTILMEQLERLPNHPLLLERLQELDIQEQESSFVLTGRQVAERYPSAQVPGSLANFTGSNRDIADAIEAFRSAPNSAVPRSSRHPEGAVQVDVEDVFAKFKEGVAKQISVDDAQAHYDLGVAYKEMALVEDAVREFGIAARDPRQQCVCQNMIGVIEIERGNLNGAIAAFLKGLDAPIRTPEQETTLEFEVGSAYEAKKMFREALDYYTRVRAKDPAFRDVQMRIDRLNRPERKSPSVRPMANADDEFDRAFDDLFTMSRNP